MDCESDKNKVKSLVASLVDIKDHVLVTSLKVPTDCILCQVAVDKSITIKPILSHRKLQHHATTTLLNQCIVPAACKEDFSIDGRYRTTASPAIKLVTMMKK